MLGKLFGRKARELKAEVKKMENKDLAEGLVGASLLVAAADGEICDKELENLTKQLAAHPSLSEYGSEIGKMVDKFSQMLEAGFRIGKTQIMREIKDCSTCDRESEDVFVAAITIAEADGEIDADEIKILTEIGAVLGLNLRNYGIEA